MTELKVVEGGEWEPVERPQKKETVVEQEVLEPDSDLEQIIEVIKSEDGFPKINDNNLYTLMEKIKPVAEKDGKLYYIKDVDPRTVAFTWDPEFKAEATGLTECGTIHTMHTYGYHGFFKPTIAEVMAQIPKEYYSKAVAFATDFGGFTNDNKHHIGVTVLYEKG